LGIDVRHVSAPEIILEAMPSPISSQRCPLTILDWSKLLGSPQGRFVQLLRQAAVSAHGNQ
jgi:hypothetical protein